ncbi:MAG TPA: discoidin domain-containing protein [Terriglobales bacterium]|nr:discoidin domain-containing protein [Terriglobales bacterium]
MRSRAFALVSKLIIGGLVPLWLLAGVATSQESSEQTAARLQELTHSLVQLSQRQPSGRPQSETLGDQAEALARVRSQLWLQLAATSPADALRLSLPPDVVSTLHESAKPFVETDARHSGQLEVMVEDYADRHRMRYFLKARDQKLELYFAANPPEHILSGAMVQVQGKQLGNVLLMESAQNLAPQNLSQTAASGTPAPLTNTFGVQSTIVILVNFQDNPVQPFDVPTTQDVVFNQVNGFYMENSQNQTWLVGDVFGWFTIAVSSSSCDFAQIQSQGEAAAINAGAILSNYNHFIYAFPNIPGCGWEGLANLGGSPGHAWVNGFMNLQVVGHEMGHQFGLLHSHSLDCGGLTLGSNCTKIEYGDAFDIMGHTVAGHFNAFQKERLGWLNYGSSLPIQFIQSSGTYTIAPYEDLSPGPKALKLLQSVDPSTGFTTYYYAEYRQDLGFDSVLSPYPASTQGVLIHSGDPSSPNNLYLLNMNPKDTTFYTAALAVGENFSDPTSGVSLTTVKADAKGAVVNVTLNPPACAPANPAITISPSQSAQVAPGTTVQFTVTVTDQDSYTCNPATFTMRAFLPNGFTSTFTNASLTLAPGATGQTTLFLTSSPGTASGSYSFTTVAANAPYASGINGTYVVTNAGDFSISANPSSVSIPQGGNGSTTISTAVSGGFSSALTLSASGLPSGATASFSSSALPAPGSGSVTLIFTVGASVPVGSYAVTVNGVGTGVNHSTNVTLSVTAPGSPPPPPPPPQISGPIPQSGWKLLYVDNQETVCGSYGGANAFDSDPNTMWQTQYCNGSPSVPHEIQIDLGATYPISGFRYKPRQDGRSRGNIKQYEFYVSLGGTNWGSPVASGNLITSASDSSEKSVTFSTVVSGRYVRLRAISEVNGGPWTNVAELNVLASGSTSGGGNSNPTVASLTLTPSSVAGGSSSTATVTLSAAAPAGSAQVGLSSGTPSVASVPAAVNLVQGQTSTTFTVTTTAVNSPTSSVITASYNNSSASATLGVTSLAPQPDFTIAANPIAVTVSPGGSGTSTVTTTVTGGFNSAISLSASGQPAGVTATFSPASIPAPGQGNSTMNISVGQNTAPGTYTLNVGATGGNIGKNASVTLTVVNTPPPPPPGSSPRSIPQNGWKLLYADSQETYCGNYAATNAFDGNFSSMWQTQYCSGSPDLPHEIQIDLGATYNVAGFRYLPRQDGKARGKITAFEFYVSTDGVNWGAASATGTLITNSTDAAEKQVLLAAPLAARYVRFRALGEINGGPWTSMAELNMLQQ